VFKHRQFAGVTQTLAGPLERHGLVERVWGKYPDLTSRDGAFSPDKAGYHLRDLGDEVLVYFREASDESLAAERLAPPGRDAASRPRDHGRGGT
jgi:hypothetical protein